MEVTKNKIKEFLDAIGQVHGDEYKAKMVVADRGSGHIMVKYPDKEEGSPILLGTLELMTKNLLNRAE